MSETETPVGLTIRGPWALLGTQAIVGAHGYRPVVLSGGRSGGLVTRGVSGLLVEATDANPNVRLALAAPELLEALRRMVERVECFQPGSLWPELGLANLAIAKAEGSTP